ncbi:hypothetical protein [Desulfocurvus vexinensis]|uniref:hypothetical protein n=1 Tax=Desulfocurvus vexinensis TaxID=399548 RepID=UPI0004B71ABA|nr:hypothetical protein [Desulfocurvus vexinensis]
MRATLAASLLGLALLLAACQPASTITTLHGVTTESNALGPRFSRVFWGTQWESVSLLGLLPARQPGALHCYNPRHGPNAAIGVSQGQSYILTRTVGDDVTLEEVLALRDALLQAQDSALDAARARLGALRTALTARGAAQADGASPQAAPGALAEQATQGARKADRQLDQAERDVRMALRRPGLLVVRWSMARESEHGASVGEAASVSGGSGATRSGLAVLGGIRVSRLYLGDDILGQWSGVRNIGAFTHWPQVTTLLIQARHVAFLSDVGMERVFRAELEIDARDAALAATDWKALASLELAAYRARVENLGGMGLLGDGGSVTLAPPPWATQGAGTAPDDWHTLYQVTTPLKALREMWTQ